LEEPAAAGSSFLIFPINLLMKKILFFSALLLCQSVYAVDSDTRLRLNQELQQQQREKEKPLQQAESEQLPSMVINGEVIPVEKNAGEVGRALYIAVMQRQWLAAQIYLETYLSLKDHEPSLALFAQAALSRVTGDLKQAEQYFREASVLQPQNLITKLELARVLTERQKNREAKQLFEAVNKQLAGSGHQAAENIRNTVDIYLAGLAQRDAWQGSVALGPRYATNINNSAEFQQTVTYYGWNEETREIVPIYEVTQGSPDPIDTQGLDFEATLSKRWSFTGNHGAKFNAISFGQAYNQHSDFNEIFINLNAGYSYFNERNQILLAPVFEHRRYGNKSLYDGYGVRAEWMRFVGKDKAFKLESEIKDLNYAEYTDQDGVESSTYLTLWKLIPDQWTLFGGLDYVDRNTQEKYMGAHQQEGFRLGVSKNFNAEFDTTLFSSFRWRQFDKFTPALGERRRDFEQNYTFVVRIPRYSFYGLTPSLTFNYNHNKSNVDWLYSYGKHRVSLKLEKRF
jgi:hypothetical protein